MEPSDAKTIAQILHDAAIDDQLHADLESGDLDVLKKYGLTERQAELLKGGKLTEIRFTIEQETDVHNSPAEAVKLLVTWIKPAGSS
jgi:hypothetical protein